MKKIRSYNHNLSVTFLLFAILALNSCRNETEDHVESLLNQMTLEEKIGQMMQICFSTITLDGSKELDLNMDKIREAIIDEHAGSFISGTGSAERWVAFNHEVQKIALEETRLGIPLLIGIDHIHGANYVDEGTMLPHSLTLSCSFDTALAEHAGRITAIETGDLGLNWIFSPVLDLGKNAYWPRLYETYGEDPLLCSKFGYSYIRSLQECEQALPYRMAACAKHFIGYSDPKTGWDRTPAEIPPQVLYEYFVPPFKAAIDAGVRTFMLNSGEVNGEPAHSSKWIQQEILRKKLGFDGVILSDIKDIMRMVEMHSAAPNEKEATFMVLDAGVDISMSCNTYEFNQYVRELVEEGRLSEARIDASVRRILQLKEELGLFDNPFPRSDNLQKIGSEEHRRLAQKMAEESMVLLKNKGILPLDPGASKILLAGFAANSRKMLNGAWTLEWLGAEEERQPSNMKTLLEAMRDEPGISSVTYMDAASISGRGAPDRMKREAASCDAIVLTLGEEPYSEFKGNISDLALPADQLELVKMAIGTGKPVIIVLVEGRPRLLEPFMDKVDAILFAGYPGFGGARAISGILTGKVNPSGHLSFSYPSSAGHAGPYYHKASDEYLPAFPFGHGLSYTSFTYENFSVNDSLSNGNFPLEFRVQVQNTGSRPGAEVVLLFMRDEVGTITRPVRRLAGFKKIWLEPGEKRQVRFELEIDQLSYPNREGQKILEDGAFSFFCGTEMCSVELIQ